MQDKVIELLPTFKKEETGRIWILFAHLTMTRKCTEIIFNQALTDVPDMSSNKNWLTINLTPEKGHSYLRKVVFPFPVRSFRIFIENDKGDKVTIFEHDYMVTSYFDFSEKPIPYSFINNRRIKITFEKPRNYHPEFLELTNPVVCYSIGSDEKLACEFEKMTSSRAVQRNAGDLLLWEGVMVLENQNCLLAYKTLKNSNPRSFLILVFLVDAQKFQSLRGSIAFV